MDDYGKAKLKVHNAQNHLEALGKKYRKRIGQINACRVELAQLEAGLPSLAEKVEQARADLKAAKATYRVLRRDRKAARSQESLSL